jgi:hypothetical protein
MIEKVVHKARLSEHNEQKQNLEYWLSRPPEERVDHVEYLRRMYYGDLPRLQRVYRIIKRSTR